MKLCRDCGVEKDIEEDFYKTNRRKSDGSVAIYVLPYCKICWGKRAKYHRDNMTPEQRAKYDLRHKTPEARRKANIKKKYGISIDDYEEMFEAQGGVCAICGSPPQGLKPLSIDHSHLRGHIRALLCPFCNSVLGYSRESVEILQAAIKYLETHELVTT